MKEKLTIVRVKIKNNNILDEASLWCADKWGRSYTIGEICSRNVLIDGTQLIIPDTNVWKHLQWNEWYYLKGYFYFKDPLKALEFKLVWVTDDV